MTVVRNPVLPGFHPDPSICRAGDEFYIAVSTFEYYPGVLIYRSKDLAEWKLVGGALDRPSQLDMRGNPSSGGVWAPCLSYCDGRFWLVYSDMKQWSHDLPFTSLGYKDVHNYLVTAESIEGPWSDPVYLNSSGFDPSLFHDDDGGKWLVNLRWDHRSAETQFAGIVLQQFDAGEKKLTGPRSIIFRGSPLGMTEGPHLYKRNGWYYLLTAEGGTTYSHAATIARSRNITGPYELHPQTPLLTSAIDYSAVKSAEEVGAPQLPFTAGGLQKAGHASLAPVDDSQDEWVMAHLCARPLPGTELCPLGRETALQPITWREDWPWPFSPHPQSEVRFRLEAQPISPHGSWREDFNGKSWSKELNTLRIPADDRYDLRVRPGWLRLAGAESPVSRFRQSVLLRRVKAFGWEFETLMEYSPEDFQQIAGLVVRYDEWNQFVLGISADEHGKRNATIISYNRGIQSITAVEELKVQDDVRFLLRAVADHSLLRFSITLPDLQEFPIGPALDASKLSDEYAQPLGFTGTFVGIGSFDCSGRALPAYFDYLQYQECIS